MKKIVGILKPFDMVQTFYVYNDGEEVEKVSTTIAGIPDTVLELSAAYDVDQVDLVGALHFGIGIMKHIQEKEITKYKANKLTINCI